LWNAQNGRAVLLADLEILNLQNRLLSEAALRLEIRGVRFSRKVVSKKCLLPTIKGWQVRTLDWILQSKATVAHLD